MNRGSSCTDSISNSDEIIELSVKALRKALQISRDEEKLQDIVGDCDAFSFVISYDTDPSQHQISALQNLLYFFASPISEVTLPKVAVSTKTEGRTRKDQIFGSDFVKSVSMGDCLCLSEVLLVSAPVKIAIHKSCKKKMKEKLDHGCFPLALSESDGLCFQPTPNQPTFSVIVNALLSPSTIVTTDDNGTQKHVFHIANLGTRYPIDKLSREKQNFNNKCGIRELFRLVRQVRETGVQVELTQIDIAFNVQNVYDKLPRFWSKTYEEFSDSTIFDNATMDKWDIHDVSSTSGSGIPNDKEQKGTFRLKQSNWINTKPVIIFGAEDDPNQTTGEISENYQELGKEFMDPVREIYLAPTTSANGNVNDMLVNTVTIDTNTVFSAKCYSTVAHFVTEKKWQYPLTRKATKSLPSKNVIYLQRMIKSIGDLAEKSFRHVSKHGVSGRVELSIRPNPHSESLRNEGHFTDVLFHAFLGIMDLLAGKHRIRMNNDLSYDSVSLKCREIIESIQAVICFRSEKKFNDIYKSKIMHLWLEAHLFLLTTTLGLTHQNKTQPLIDWIKSTVGSTSSYDPLLVCQRLTEGNSLYTHVTQLGSVENDDVLPEIKNILSKYLSALGFSEDGMSTLVSMMRREISPFRAYLSLNLSDKLVLAAQLSTNVIPSIAAYLDRTSNEDLMEQQEENVISHNAGGDSEEIDQNHAKDLNSYLEYGDELTDSHFDLEVSLSTMAYQSIALLHQNAQVPFDSMANQSYKANPLVSIMSLFADILRHFEVSDPLFFKRFISFFKKLHTDEHSLEFITKMRDSKHDWVLLCARLNVGSDLHRLSRTEAIQTVCGCLHFPCDSVAYTNTWNNVEEIPNINKALNEALSSITSVELPARKKSGTRRFYRCHDCLHISIPKMDLVIAHEDNISTCFGESIRYDDPYSMLHATFYPDKNGGVVHGSQNALQFIIQETMSKYDDLSDEFFDCEGSKHALIGDALSMSALEERCNNELFDTDSFHTYNNVILPLLSKVTKKSIALYDLEKSCVTFHFFQEASQKVITYGPIHNLTWKPKKKCTIFFAMCQSPGSYQYAHSVLLEDPVLLGETTTSTTHHMLLRDTCLMTRSRLGKTVIVRGKKRVQELFRRAMTQPNVQHPNFSTTSQDHQYLIQITLYLEELHHMNIKLEDLVTPSVQKLLRKCGITDVLDVMKVLAFQKEENHHDVCILATALCLKYKLWLCILTQKGHEKRSYMFWFDPSLEKVAYFCKESHVFMRSYSQIIYLRMTTHNDDRIQSLYYWELPKGNAYCIAHNPNITLTSRFSYIHKDILEKVLAQIKCQYNASIHIDNTDQMLSLEQANVFPLSINSDSVDHICTQTIVMILYHPEHCSIKRKYMTYMFHRKLSQKALKKIRKKIKETYFTGRVDKKMITMEWDTSRLFPQTGEIVSSFLVVIISLVAVLSKSPKTFEAALSNLGKVDNLAQKCQEWVRDIASGILEVNMLPDWLLNIHFTLEETETDTSLSET